MNQHPTDNLTPLLHPNYTLTKKDTNTLFRYLSQTSDQVLFRPYIWDSIYRCTPKKQKMLSLDEFSRIKSDHLNSLISVEFGVLCQLQLSPNTIHAASITQVTAALLHLLDIKILSSDGHAPIALSHIVSTISFFLNSAFSSPMPQFPPSSFQHIHQATQQRLLGTWTDVHFFPQAEIPTQTLVHLTNFIHWFITHCTHRILLDNDQSPHYPIIHAFVHKEFSYYAEFLHSIDISPQSLLNHWFSSSLQSILPSHLIFHIVDLLICEHVPIIYRLIFAVFEYYTSTCSECDYHMSDEYYHHFTQPLPSTMELQTFHKLLFPFFDPIDMDHINSLLTQTQPTQQQLPSQLEQTTFTSSSFTGLPFSSPDPAPFSSPNNSNSAFADPARYTAFNNHNHNNNNTTSSYFEPLYTQDLGIFDNPRNSTSNKHHHMTMGSCASSTSSFLHSSGLPSFPHSLPRQTSASNPASHITNSVNPNSVNITNSVASSSTYSLQPPSIHPSSKYTPQITQPYPPQQHPSHDFPLYPPPPTQSTLNAANKPHNFSPPPGTRTITPLHNTFHQAQRFGMKSNSRLQVETDVSQSFSPSASPAAVMGNMASLSSAWFNPDHQSEANVDELPKHSQVMVNNYCAQQPATQTILNEFQINVPPHLHSHDSHGQKLENEPSGTKPETLNDTLAIIQTSYPHNTLHSNHKHSHTHTQSPQASQLGDLTQPPPPPLQSPHRHAQSPPLTSTLFPFDVNSPSTFCTTVPMEQTSSCQDSAKHAAYMTNSSNSCTPVTSPRANPPCSRRFGQSQAGISDNGQTDSTSNFLYPRFTACPEITPVQCSGGSRSRREGSNQKHSHNQSNKSTDGLSQQRSGQSRGELNINVITMTDHPNKSNSHSIQNGVGNHHSDKLNHANSHNTHIANSVISDMCSKGCGGDGGDSRHPTFSPYITPPPLSSSQQQPLFFDDSQRQHQPDISPRRHSQYLHQNPNQSPNQPSLTCHHSSTKSLMFSPWHTSIDDTAKSTQQQQQHNQRPSQHPSLTPQNAPTQTHVQPSPAWTYHHPASNTSPIYPNNLPMHSPPFHHLPQQPVQPVPQHNHQQSNRTHQSNANTTQQPQQRQQPQQQPNDFLLVPIQITSSTVLGKPHHHHHHRDQDDSSSIITVNTNTCGHARSAQLSQTTTNPVHHHTHPTASPNPYATFRAPQDIPQRLRGVSTQYVPPNLFADKMSSTATNSNLFADKTSTAMISRRDSQQDFIPNNQSHHGDDSNSHSSTLHPNASFNAGYDPNSPPFTPSLYQPNLFRYQSQPQLLTADNSTGQMTDNHLPLAPQFKPQLQSSLQTIQQHANSPDRSLAQHHLTQNPHHTLNSRQSQTSSNNPHQSSRTDTSSTDFTAIYPDIQRPTHNSREHRKRLSRVGSNQSNDSNAMTISTKNPFMDDFTR